MIVALCLANAILAPRVEFKQKLDSVRPGMSEAAVIEVLGKPDDVQTSADPTTRSYESRVLCYGTIRHLGPATLASVAFDLDGKVSSIAGTRGEQFLPEEELRPLLRDCSRPRDEYAYDPLHVIRVANRLRRLEKTKAIKVLLELDALGQSDMFWQTLALFRPSKPGFKHLPGLGGYSPRPPVDSSRMPDYPLLIVDDIPFFIDPGITLSGYPESFPRWITRVGETLEMRAKVLVPGNPFVAAQKAWASEVAILGAERRSYRFGSERLPVETQAILLARTAILVPPPRAYYIIPDAEELPKVAKLFVKEGARWNAARQMFLASTGVPRPTWKSDLPFWKIDETVGNVTLSAHFTVYGSEAYGIYSFSQRGSQENHTMVMRCQDRHGKVIGSFKDKIGGWTSGTGTEFSFKTDDVSTIEITFDGKTVRTARSLF